MAGSVKVGERHDARARCPYCRDAVADGTDRAACVRCGCALHVECAEALLRCPTLGCGGALAHAPSPAAAVGATVGAAPDELEVRIIRPRGGALRAAARRAAVLSVVFATTLLTTTLALDIRWTEVAMFVVMGLLVGVAAFQLALLEALADRTRSRLVHRATAVGTWLLTVGSSAAAWFLGIVVEGLLRGHELGSAVDRSGRQMLDALQTNAGPTAGMAAFAVPFAATAWGRLRRWSTVRQLLVSTGASLLATGALQGGLRDFAAKGDRISAVMVVVAAIALPLAYRFADPGVVRDLVRRGRDLGKGRA